MTGPHGAASEECRRIFERLSEYLDGEMGAAPCEHLERHLDDCPPCREFLESLRRTVRLLGRSEAVAIPEDLRVDLLAAFRRMRDGR